MIIASLIRKAAQIALYMTQAQGTQMEHGKRQLYPYAQKRSARLSHDIQYSPPLPEDQPIKWYEPLYDPLYWDRCTYQESTIFNLLTQTTMISKMETGQYDTIFSFSTAIHDIRLSMSLLPDTWAWKKMYTAEIAIPLSRGPPSPLPRPRNSPTNHIPLRFCN